MPAAAYPPPSNTSSHHLYCHCNYSRAVLFEHCVPLLQQTTLLLGGGQHLRLERQSSDGSNDEQSQSVVAVVWLANEAECFGVIAWGRRWSGTCMQQWMRWNHKHHNRHPPSLRMDHRARRRWSTRICTARDVQYDRDTTRRAEEGAVSRCRGFGWDATRYDGDEHRLHLAAHRKGNTSTTNQNHTHLIL